MRLPTEKDRRAIELTMTPMIDVVFLLLVFFIWTSSFDLPEFDLPSSIAQPPVGGVESESINLDAEEYDEIVVRLDKIEGRLEIRINDETISGLESLSIQLQVILDLGVQPPVIIDPSDTVTVSSAVLVYDLARNVGADRVLFAARSD